MLPLILLLIILAVIYYLGSGKFGRAQTQRWIDYFARKPAVHGFLNHHHGKFRALAHYIEFGGLFLILYWCWDNWLASGQFRWHFLPALVVAALSALAAYMDELHQLKSGSRQFRRVDFLYSLCGIAIAALIVRYQEIFRGF